MQFTNRGIHRDVGYFFIGLIISFSISGIMLNHRRDWYPTRYTSEVKEIQYQLDSINESSVNKMVKDLEVEDNVRRFVIEEDVLRVSLVENDIKLNLETESGEIVTYRKTPLISQIYTLHKSTSDWWIYYSDIFGAGMLLIAITGLYMFPKGSKNSFRKRGWKLAVVGIIFPLIFLFLLA